MGMFDMTFHESYGHVTENQLAAYKAHNVSPSDHDQLVELFKDNRAAITAIVMDKAYHLGNSFSIYLVHEDLELQRTGL